MYGSEFLLLAVAIMAILFALYKSYKKLYYYPKELEQFPSYTISFLNYIQYMNKISSGSEHPSSALIQFFYSLSQLAEKEGIGAVWFGYKPIVFVFKAHIVKDILSNPEECVQTWEKDLIMKPTTGEGILISSGNKWRRRRNMLNPAFHARILQNYMETFNTGAEILVDKMKVSVNKPWTDLGPLLGESALSILCDSIFGRKQDDQETQATMQAWKDLGEISAHRILRPWTFNNTIFNLTSEGRKLRKAKEIADAFSKKVINEKMKAMLAVRANENKIQERDECNISRKKGSTFLEFLLVCHLDDKTLTLEDVLNEVNTFMAAGHVTTAAALNWTTYMLGLLPEVQEKVVEELRGIFGDDIHRATTNEDLKKMTYLDKVIKEVMRIYPPVPLMGVKFKENKIIGSFTIPKDVTCGVAIYKLHRDQEVFPNPEEFDAERFSPENCRKRHPYAYMPFSMGPRMCIGHQFAMMELKVILSKLLRQFEFTSLDPRNRSQEMYAVVLTNSKPLRIHLKRRTPA
ncbi:Cytochrome P450 4C1, partial [Stegodyphus mimosarum]